MHMRDSGLVKRDSHEILDSDESRFTSPESRQ